MPENLNAAVAVIGIRSSASRSSDSGANLTPFDEVALKLSGGLPETGCDLPLNGNHLITPTSTTFTDSGQHPFRGHVNVVP